MLFDKIDVRPILRGHFLTLKDNAFGSRISRADLIVFFGIPVFASVGISLSGFSFRIDAVNGFLNLFSILTGLLLNVLVLVVSLASSKTNDGIDTQRRTRLIREIFSTICYSVLVAVLVICFALVALSYMKSNAGATTGRLTTFALPALTTHFVLSLFAVLKRMYVLVDKDLRSNPQSKAA